MACLHSPPTPGAVTAGNGTGPAAGSGVAGEDQPL